MLYLYSLIFLALQLQLVIPQSYNVWKLTIYKLPTTSQNIYVIAPSILQLNEEAIPDENDNKNENAYSSKESADNGEVYVYSLIKNGKGAGRTKDVRTDDGRDKIVGGFEVDINLYPYHVAYGTNCGGAIIHDMWVMTAGHCGIKPYVRVGSKYLNQGRKVLVAKNFIHQGWSEKNKAHIFDYDFQLLKLSEALVFEDNIQPIKIGRMEDLEVGTVLTVTGWGHTVENGAYSRVLRAVRVPIIAKDTCQHVRFPFFRGSLTNRMFCAGYAEGHRDACQVGYGRAFLDMFDENRLSRLKLQRFYALKYEGDSGGPAVIDDRLVGIISFGYGCATPESYGVYSNVAMVRDWVQSIVGDEIEIDYILGGYPIKIQEVPYHLSYGDVCGAALIHKTWAITTAHCGTNHTYIRVGKTWRLEGSPVKIQDHIAHPKYQLEHAFDYDVQLLKLKALRFSKSVKSIKIGNNNGGYVLVSGWGYSEEKGEYNDTLQQVKVHIVPMETCQEVDKSWYNHTLTTRMFCAGGWEFDACQGDSGGGAISGSGELIGLSSFGYGCGRKMPGVYTNLTDPDIRQWIYKYTGV